MTVPVPSLNDIAFQISGLTYNISNFLKENKHPEPSFEANGPPRFPAAPADVQAARQKLLELTLQLHNLILGPEERIRRQTAEYVDPATLRWITHFNIAKHVPTESTISYSDLAAAANVPETQLKRILRFTMLNGYFTEPSPGQVAHSAMSLLLATSPPIQDYVGHAIGFSYPVSTKMVEMTERYRGGEAKNETAFNVAFDTPLPMFGWLKGEPEHSERFGRLMGAMKAAPVYSVQHLVTGYDWEALENGKVVDVGGSLGHVSLAVAAAHPKLEFVVQDLPEVIEQAKAKQAPTSPAGSKLSFMPHDFFSSQPVDDGDVYLLRQILHDWPDAEAIVILKHLVASLRKPNARILVMDQVVPPPGLLPNAQEKAARTIDLVVMSHFNGKQRDMDDWKRVFAAVDKRLCVSKMVAQPGSVLSIMELSLKSEPMTNGHITTTEDAKDPQSNNAPSQQNGAEKAVDVRDSISNGHAASPISNGTSHEAPVDHVPSSTAVTGQPLSVSESTTDAKTADPTTQNPAVDHLGEPETIAENGNHSESSLPSVVSKTLTEIFQPVVGVAEGTIPITNGEIGGEVAGTQSKPPPSTHVSEL